MPSHDTYHVAPINDLVVHDTTSDECVCVPRVDPVQRDDGSMGWILVHHSLDGREALEQIRANEQHQWDNFTTIRRIQWCRCRQDSWPHVWGAPGSFDPSDHERVPPSLHWQLGQFQDDARFAGLIPKPAGGSPNTPGMWEA